MKVVLQTQFQENYGSHDWDGSGQCPQYWKFKGGSTYVIANLTPKQVEEMLPPHIGEIYNLIEQSSDYVKEYVISSHIAEDNEKVCEDWETPIIIEKVDGEYIATEVTKNDEYSFLDERIEEQRFSYVMKPKGQKENLTTTYLMKNGDLVDHQNMVDYMKSTANNTSENSHRSIL